jgi:putative solute:sodium symporter small subunit
MDKEKLEAYHRENIQLIIILLAIWFAVSYVGAILAQPLSKLSIFGFPMHYWVSAQLSVITFVILIFVYAHLMNKLDQKYGVEE